MNNVVKNRPQPLPTKIADWTRTMKIERTLNDLVEDAHRVLVDKKEYRDFLEAVWDEDAVEGSLACDNFKAAEMIREWAKVQGTELAGKRLATIVKSLGVVLRRYDASRKQRRNTVGGEQVPGDNGD